MTIVPSHNQENKNMNRIPVILDTDIGGDIDDTWALALMLKSPELDVKLITTATEDTVYRAKVACKLLEVAGRTDVLVGIGIKQKMDIISKTQAMWIEDYDLKSFPGTLHADGVEAMINVILSSPQPVTLISIGPLPNIAAALKREPRIAARCRFVSMHGSIHRQHEGKPDAIAEYNVKADIPASKAVFTAPWQSMTITPLDTCGLIRLTGAKYETVRACKDPLTAAVIENYRIWSWVGDQFPKRSSILFDTVAVYLAFSEKGLRMENLKIVVDDAGFTQIDPTGKPMRVAIDWENLAGFEDFLVERLTKG
jgi:inosine-uridine nucleoside N-ribohydrolase